MYTIRTSKPKAILWLSLSLLTLGLFFRPEIYGDVFNIVISGSPVQQKLAAIMERIEAPREEPFWLFDFSGDTNWFGYFSALAFMLLCLYFVLKWLAKLLDFRRQISVGPEGLYVRKLGLTGWDQIKKIDIMRRDLLGDYDEGSGFDTTRYFLYFERTRGKTISIQLDALSWNWNRLAAAVKHHSDGLRALRPKPKEGWLDQIRRITRSRKKHRDKFRDIDL